MSSYLETLGFAQNVAAGTDFVFAVDGDNIDMVGSDITIDASGTVVTLERPGLYHVEWSVNLGSATLPAIVGLWENGEESSALANAAGVGNFSSGALIYVAPGEEPYTLSLRNFSGPLAIEGTPTAENIAASIRILRFAEGPN